MPSGLARRLKKLAEKDQAGHGLIRQVCEMDEAILVGAEGENTDIGLKNFLSEVVILQPTMYSGKRLGALANAHRVELMVRDQ